MDSSHGDTAARLEALEIKAAFAEDLLDQLNLVIYRQQRQMEALTEQLAQLRQQMPAPGEAAARNPRDELPPHY
ncbi:SlyX family protein [Xylophilus sp.]|uniref:SlyX family protein n=1 Tax=Xylophilus sp. TaxID=2653893 RepID=UPI0013B9813C|nr:SlyX family protein [Xylophilus sp.]KAF1048594.1 MAG: Protein SlyX [Xylophilus sp.]